jgi:transcriptional regulator with XRE-family HTH domain
LRAAKAIPQERLARALGVKQAQVSKLERQDNMRLSTLRKLVGALGGELELRARFQDEPGDVILRGPWTRAAKAQVKPRARKKT